MTDDPLLNRQLANFRLERLLGRGGMGQVYYGWDVKLQRPVAVKVIDFRFRDNPTYARRFLHEAQAVATWRHENIAQVYYADEEGELYFFAMEYVDGLDVGQLLSHYAAKGELMPQADVVRIGRAVASALDYAHAKSIVHRDVKPSNVIVGRDGRVVLTDFGLALDVHQGSMGEVFGSALYIAPEQARRSSEAIPQSDLYSLGIMLYEMLTGVVPFDDPSPTAVALQHLTQPPPAPRTLNPDLNMETEAVLLKALSKSPHERYQSGLELITALENTLQASQKTDKPAPLPPLPAGMQREPSLARVSQMTVSEVVASLAPAAARPPRPEPPPVQRQPARPPRQQLVLLTLSGCILVLMLGTTLAGLLLGNPLKGLVPIAESPVNTEIALTLASATLPASARSTEPATAAPVPLVKYPNGKRFMFFYDDSSFYLLNLSDSNVPINWVAFERLSNTDVPLNRFNGSRWGEFYSTSKPSWCMALEVLESASHLDPPECGHDHLYLSLRTPTRTDPVVFWTVKEGSSQFRVLWREDGQDEEVARCEIAAGTCEAFLP